MGWRLSIFPMRKTEINTWVDDTLDSDPSGFIDAEIIKAKLESIEAALERIEEKLGGRSEIPEEASSN